MPTIKSEKVLIVSGNKAFGQQIADAVRADGYTVSFVNSGAEGLMNAASFSPDLILLDTAIYDIDAYAFLSRKAASVTPAVAKAPLFLISNQGAPLNMHHITEGAVAELIANMEASPANIVARIDARFKHQVGTSAFGTDPLALKGPIIVWAEDDRLISSILAKKFAAVGFNMIHAKNGVETLEALKTIVPNAIVLDLLMPDMNGFEVLEKIRVDQRLKDVPAMILSNLSKPSDIEKANSLGAKKFIIKAAVSLDQIVAEVKGICAK